MTVILDAGALLALERGHTLVEHFFRDARAAGRPAVTHGGVVGQVWRGGGARQARLARALAATSVVPLTAGLGRDAGRLLAEAGTSDVIDAAVVCLAADGDEILTSDPGDIAQLVAASGVDALIVAI